MWSSSYAAAAGRIVCGVHHARLCVHRCPGLADVCAQLLRHICSVEQVARFSNANCQAALPSKLFPLFLHGLAGVCDHFQLPCKLAFPAVICWHSSSFLHAAKSIGHRQQRVDAVPDLQMVPTVSRSGPLFRTRHPCAVGVASRPHVPHRQSQVSPISDGC